MDEFGYLSVMLSIILGLAVAQLLAGARGCLLARSRVRGYLLTHLWAGAVLLIITQSWWSMFGLRSQHDWTFTAFATLLAQNIALFLVAGLVYPDIPADRPTDLRAHYFDQRRHFFGMLAAVVLLSVVSHYAIFRSWPDERDFKFHLLFFVLSLSGGIIPRERFHQFATVFSCGAILCYVLWLFARLQ